MFAPRRFVSRLLPPGVIACVAFAFAPVVRADTSDVIGAEALFRSGKDLLAQKDYAHACPKLAESYRLDPASGTLLALAICHEREGKLASAWGEYADVASRSKVESRPDREAAARGRAAELGAEVSTLTIGVSDAAMVNGLEIRRNGVLITPAWFGTPVPVDGGTVSIDVQAPGKKPRHLEIVLAPSGDRQTVTIPPLDDAGASKPETPPAPLVAPVAPERSAAVGPAPGPAPMLAPATDSPRSGLGPLQVTGLVAGACGVVGLGLGAFFAFQAVDKNNASQGECEGDLCTPLGKQDRSDAVSAGNIATGAIIGGGVLVAAGAVLYLFGHGSREGSAPDNHASLQVVPTGGEHGLGGALQGTF